MTPTLSTLSTLALSLSWCDEDRDLLGLPSRPLSLVSHHLLRLMGSRVMETDPGYETIEGELRDMTLYTWLHTAPLDEVCEAMWSGAWRAMLEVAMDPHAIGETLAEWRERRPRLGPDAHAPRHRRRQSRGPENPIADAEKSVARRQRRYARPHGRRRFPLHDPRRPDDRRAQENRRDGLLRPAQLRGRRMSVLHRKGGALFFGEQARS